MLSRFANKVVIALATLAAAAGTARLGEWQLDRAAQKTALERTLDERAAEPPLPAAQLARDLGMAAQQYYRRTELVGHWIPERTVFLENRQMHGQPGFFVVTPLALADGSAVLVQRGWQPRDLLDRTKVADVLSPPGEQRVAGRIAPPPGRLYQFAGPGEGRIRQNLDLAAFGVETGLSLRPLSLQQLDGSADGLQRDWPKPAVDVQKNKGYAFQWFGLSALIVFLYVWFQLVRPWRARSRH